MLKKLKLKFVCMHMTVVTVMLVLIFSLIIKITEQNMEKTTHMVMNKIGINSGVGDPMQVLIRDSILSTQHTVMEELICNCIVIGIISFLLFLLFSILFANWAVKPVEQAWKQQKQFVADASHELKTPLTVILTNAELLKEEALSEDQVHQLSSAVYSKACQMKKLTAALLQLSHSEQRTSEHSFTKFNYSYLVQTCIFQYEPVFWEEGLELTAEIQPDIIIKADSESIRQVIEILLDNALKYAHPDTKIKVHLSHQGRCTVFSVITEGEPISEENLIKIFHRFYRIDTERRQDGSHGLGLSIAKNIIEQHKGKIWAESQDGLNSFYVKLSAIPSDKAGS